MAEGAEAEEEEGVEVEVVPARDQAEDLTPVEDQARATTATEAESTITTDMEVPMLLHLNQD